MRNLTLTILSILCLLSCSESEKAKPNSIGEAPEVKQVEPIKLEKKEPIPTTISVQEVSRIALIEAEQFITNAKSNGIDYSSVTETLEKAKLEYDNGEFKKAQKLAVSVRQQVEDLLKNK